jgi:hypothetical protein
VATQVLTPVLVQAAATTVTANLTNVTAGTGITGGNTVQLLNVPGQTFLYVVVGATGGTLQVNVGATLFGQSFAAFATLTLVLSNNYIIGPFHTALEQPNSNNVTLVTSGALVSTMTCLQLSGVF